MRFTLVIDTDNDAFHPDPRPEVLRLLGAVRAQVEEGRSEGRLRDVNGNTVAQWQGLPDGA